MTKIGLRYPPMIGEHSETFATGVEGQGRVALAQNWTVDEQGGETPPPEPGEATLTIVLERNEATAPGGTYISAQLDNADVRNGDWRRHAFFKWYFDDNGTFKYIEDPTFRWRDKGWGLGFDTSHQWYPSPAEFASEFSSSGNRYIEKTIACDCRYENATTGIIESPSNAVNGLVTTTFRIWDPDWRFAGDKTVCYSSTGATGQEPAGAQIFTDIVAALAEYNDGDMDKRLLINGQEIHDATNWPTLLTQAQNQKDRRHIGVYPYGATAKIVYPFRTDLGKCIGYARGVENFLEATAFGIDLDGPYDPLNPTAIPSTNHLFDGIAPDANTKVGKPEKYNQRVQYCYYEVRVAGMNTCMDPTNQTAKINCFDVLLTKWWDYGYYEGRAWDYNMFRGGGILQPNGTPMAGPRYGSEGFPNHGSYRTTGPAYRTVVRQVDFGNNPNHSNNGFQPILRIAGRTQSHPYSNERGEVAMVSVGEIRGLASCQVGAYGARIDHVPCDAFCVVIENYEAAPAPKSSRVLAQVVPGSELRNWLVTIAANSPPFAPKFAFGPHLKEQFYPYVIAGWEHRYYNGTLVDLRPSIDPGVVEDLSEYSFQIPGGLRLVEWAWDLSAGNNAYPYPPEFAVEWGNNVWLGTGWPNNYDGDDIEFFDMTPTRDSGWIGHYTYDSWPGTEDYIEFAASDHPKAAPLLGAAAYGGGSKAEPWAMYNIAGEWRDPTSFNRGCW